jgi:hypothetical protein
MDQNVIARNLAAVENHFHSEARNEVEAALATFTDDIVWEAPALNGLAHLRDARWQDLARARLRHGTPRAGCHGGGPGMIGRSGWRRIPSP